jgi:hypothetical protein
LSPFSPSISVAPTWSRGHPGNDSFHFIFLILDSIFLIVIVGGRVQLGPLGTAAINRPIVPAPGDFGDGEIGGMIGRGNLSTRRKPAPMLFCPPRTLAAVVGSQRLTA